MVNKRFYSGKTYSHATGHSCAFRQWRADSHCNLIHGYSLGFKFVFEAQELDERNWVYDFGNCKWIKAWLEENFDHTLAVDVKDPELLNLTELGTKGLAKVVEMNGVGCEKFAEHVYNFVAPQVKEQTGGRVKLKSVEVFEHGANSAIVEDLQVAEPVVERVALN